MTTLTKQHAAAPPMSDGPAAPSHPPRGTPFWMLALLGVVLASALFGAGGLWVYYGTAVFFDLLAAGIAACF